MLHERPVRRLCCARLVPDKVTDLPHVHDVRDDDGRRGQHHPHSSSKNFTFRIRRQAPFIMFRWPPSRSARSSFGFLADKIGRKRTIVVGLILYGIEFRAVRFRQRLFVFRRVLAAAGIGISVFKTGALALIGDITKSTTDHSSFMNTLEGFFGIGAIIGPAIVATLLAANLSWRWLYVIAAGICALLLILALSLSSIRRPDKASPPKSIPISSTPSHAQEPVCLGFLDDGDAVCGCRDRPSMSGCRPSSRTIEASSPGFPALRSHDLLRSQSLRSFRGRLAGQPFSLDMGPGAIRCRDLPVRSRLAAWRGRIWASISCRFPDCSCR